MSFLANNCQSDVIENFHKLVDECKTRASNFRAGTVSENPSFWTKNVHDKAVLRLVFGLSIPISCKIEQYRIPREINFPPSELELLEQEINKMLLQGVIEPVHNTPENGEFISNIFSRPKKDGGLRVILNLKNFNEFVVKSHFKMNTLQTAIDLITPNAYMASVDFKSAYYSIAVKPQHRKYLRFFFNGQKYQFCVLPNGLATGPRDFSQVAKALFRILRSRGHSNTYYLDDSFLVHQTFQGCVDNVVDTLRVSSQAGFVVHPQKSVLIPTQRLVFLGFVLCSVTMTVCLTTEKCSKIKAFIQTVLGKTSLPIQTVAELVGQLVATFPAVPYGKLFYRQTDIEKSLALKSARGDFSHTMSLSEQAKLDLKWWLANLDTSCTNISSKNPDLTLKTDASNFGYGGYVNSKSLQGQWNRNEQNLHINLKELLAVLHCLRGLCGSVRNKTIKVMTDNTTTLCYINNMGGKIPNCNAVARKIWLWALETQNWLICVFIPGRCNVVADRLSRKLNETTEWSLNEQYAKAIFKRFPGLEIDLFASNCNHKLSRYVSWMSDEGAEFCDAFSLDWAQFYAYAFPPFTLIGKVLRKVQLDGADMVIIVPEWRSQLWFAKLMLMLSDDPLYLPRNGGAIYNPINRKASPVTARFIACRISGSGMTIADCLRL